ncbi:MAG: hypothetical protein LBD58_01925 [Treponema sp.]|jgi:hypothetical protein|nr:hypothetical protein [Treponema sp.]
MKYATYAYQTRVTFSYPVQSHFFLLRCTPPQNAYQKIVKEQCLVSPVSGSPLSRGTDSFGDIVHSGSIQEDHAFFEIETCGEIKLADAYCIRDEKPNRLYLYESPFTNYNETIRSLLRGPLKSASWNSEDSITEKYGNFPLRFLRR